MENTIIKELENKLLSIINKDSAFSISFEPLDVDKKGFKINIILNAEDSELLLISTFIDNIYKICFLSGIENNQISYTLLVEHECDCINILIDLFLEKD